MNRRRGLGELPPDIRAKLPGTGYRAGEPVMDGAGFSHGEPNVPSQPVPYRPRITATTRGFIVTDSAQKIVTENLLRAYLMLQNRSADTIYLAFGASVDNTFINAIELAAGSVYEPNTNGTMMIVSDIYAIGATTGLLLSITEGLLIG